MSIYVRELFRTVRLFVELTEVPDYFFHAMAVSLGIPILSREESSYLIHEKNGQLVKNYHELKPALDKYLDLLNPWNESLVEALDIIENNNEQKLIDRWKEMLQIKSASEVIS